MKLVPIALILLLPACTPRREFVRFGYAGTFHPGPQPGSQNFSGPESEYDSYELIDHGTVPNQGIPSMYANPYSGYGFSNRW